jgi:hypothetical protein
MLDGMDTPHDAFREAQLRVRARLGPGRPSRRPRARKAVADGPPLFSADLAEAALGHARGGKTGRAYERDDLFEPRVPLMRAWADYCAGKGVTSAEVTPLHHRKAS